MNKPHISTPQFTKEEQKANRERWCAALRSGKYKQGRGRLCMIPQPSIANQTELGLDIKYVRSGVNKIEECKFCCMGVAGVEFPTIGYHWAAIHEEDMLAWFGINKYDRDKLERWNDGFTAGNYVYEEYHHPPIDFNAIAGRIMELDYSERVY